MVGIWGGLLFTSRPGPGRALDTVGSEELSKVINGGAAERRPRAAGTSHTIVGRASPIGTSMWS